MNVRQHYYSGENLDENKPNSSFNVSLKIVLLHSVSSVVKVNFPIKIADSVLNILCKNYGKQSMVGSK